jgi:hypothetical protein
MSRTSNATRNRLALEATGWWIGPDSRGNKVKPRRPSGKIGRSILFARPDSPCPNSIPNPPPPASRSSWRHQGRAAPRGRLRAHGTDEEGHRRGAADVGHRLRRLRRLSLRPRKRPRGRLLRGRLLATQGQPDALPLRQLPSSCRAKASTRPADFASTSRSWTTSIFPRRASSSAHPTARSRGRDANPPAAIAPCFHLGRGRQSTSGEPGRIVRWRAGLRQRPESSPRPPLPTKATAWRSIGVFGCGRGTAGARS